MQHAKFYNEVKVFLKLFSPFKVETIVKDSFSENSNYGQESLLEMIIEFKNLEDSVVIFQALKTSPTSLTSAASATSLASTASKAQFSQKTS